MPGLLRSRRGLLAALFGCPPPPLPGRKVLVTVFLRGGADGLALVPPLAERGLARLRPSLALPPPGAEERSPTALDERFGLHPALAPLLPAWHEGRLAIVHAVGSDDDTRSHFEAQDQVEQGAAAGRPLAGGWIGRMLRAEVAAGGGSAASGHDQDLAQRGPAFPTERAERTTEGTAGGAAASGHDQDHAQHGVGLSAVAVGPLVPEALRGAPMAAAFESLDELASHGRAAPAALEALARLYEPEPGLLGQAGRDTLDLLRRVSALRPDGGRGPAGARPAGTGLRAGLRDVADLVRAGVGLRAACLDVGGWDTHFFQGSGAGLLAGRAAELADGLASFLADLGPRRDDVVVVVLTEFGRRAHENASFGTDHGRASVALVIGSGVAGGRVHARWPGLSDDALEGPGDLRVTTDYRDVLCEVVALAGGPAPDVVFPGHTPRPVGLLA